MSPNLQPQSLTTPFDMSGFGFNQNKPGPMQKMDDLRAMLQRSLAPSCIGTSLLNTQPNNQGIQAQTPSFNT